MEDRRCGRVAEPSSSVPSTNYLGLDMRRRLTSRKASICGANDRLKNQDLAIWESCGAFLGGDGAVMMQEFPDSAPCAVAKLLKRECPDAR